VIASRNWNGNRGAVTWGNGSTGVSGTVSAANSLVGSNGGESVRYNVNALRNGSYVVVSTSWNGGRGGAAWGHDSTAGSGAVAAGNSLVSSNPADGVVSYSVSSLSNGNYVVGSPIWNGSRGAATWGDGSTGVSGTVSAANSLVG